MPHRHHRPVSEDVMLREAESEKCTICLLLRQIYGETRNGDIKLKARVCTSMAKSMVRKLQEYKKAVQ